jgi:hypothetical protein
MGKAVAETSSIFESMPPVGANQERLGKTESLPNDGL